MKTKDKSLEDYGCEGTTADLFPLDDNAAKEFKEMIAMAKIKISAQKTNEAIEKVDSKHCKRLEEG